MIDELYKPLKREWERLATDTRDWIAHMGRKYSKGTNNDIRAVRETLRDTTSRLGTMDAHMQRAAPETNAGVRDLATRIQVYLEDTDPQFEQLLIRSEGDPTAVKYAQDVKRAREAVAKQVQVIYDATLVNVTSSTPPGAGPLPGTGSGSATSASSGGANPPPPPNPPPVSAPATPVVSPGDAGYLFLTTMSCLVGKSVGNLPDVTEDDYKFTLQLFQDDEPFLLNDKKLNHLTLSWNTVVQVFFNPDQFSALAKSCSTIDSLINADSATQEANLLEIHDDLESLYDLVEAKVIRTTTEILTSNL